MMNLWYQIYLHDSILHSYLEGHHASYFTWLIEESKQQIKHDCYKSIDIHTGVKPTTPAKTKQAQQRCYYKEKT